MAVEARIRPTEGETGPATAHSYGLLLLGGLFVVVGALWLLDIAGVVRLQADVVLPAALTVVGLGLMVGAFDGPLPGLVLAGVFLTLAVVVAAVLPFGAFSEGVGERTYRITHEQGLERGYELGLGNLVIDLQSLDLTRSSSLTASVGAGELVVRVPADLPVVILARTGAGEVDLLGEVATGLSLERTYRSEGGGHPMLTLDLEVGTGSIEVTR